MRTRAIVLTIAVVAFASSSPLGCDGAPAINVEESVSIADSTRTSQSAVVGVVETIGITDSAQMFPPASIRLTDTIGITDSYRLVCQQPPPLPIKATVTVTSPKAGVVWIGGTAQNIAWTTTGKGIDHIDIYFSIDGGKSMIAIACDELNDGSYTWKVPSKSSKTVLVRVLAFGIKGETLALGDSGPFTISIK